MGLGPKVSDDEKATIRRLAGEGRTAAEIGKALNRPRASVSYVMERMGLPTSNRGASSTARTKASADSPGDSGAVPEFGSGGGAGDALAEALAAAKEATSGGKKKDDAVEAEIVGRLGDWGTPGGDSKKGGDKEDPTGKGLVDLLDGLTGIICRIYATSRKVPWTPKLAAAFKLTAAERAQLNMLAPYAAPYVKLLLAHVPEIAAGMFAIVYWQILGDRLGYIKQTAKALEPEKKPAEKEAKKK